MTRTHWLLLASWFALAALSGCAATARPPTTIAVRVSGEVAKARVRTATAKVQKLKDEVPAELKPVVQSVEDDLVDATAQLEAQTLAVDRLDRDIAKMAERMERETIWRQRWKRAALTLGALLLAAGLWIFRKPLLALL